jgi:hypothetical protein
MSAKHKFFPGRQPTKCLSILNRHLRVVRHVTCTHSPILHSPDADSSDSDDDINSISNVIESDLVQMCFLAMDLLTLLTSFDMHERDVTQRGGNDISI